MSPSTTACIAVCADDFGLHDAVTRGVLALAERGRVNGVGCLVGAPSWQSARRELGALAAKGIDIGLHLDLTEQPIDASMKFALPRLIVQALLRRLPEPAIEAEIARQLDRFEQDLGRAPDYIDGHQHVHQLPQVRDALLRVIARGNSRPWLRSTRRARELQAPSDATLAERLKPRVIERLGAAALERAADAVPLAHNRRLLGVHGFRADATGAAGYRAWLDAWLAVTADDDLLMCHPARWHGEALRNDDPIAHARAIECEVLASDWMGEALARHGVTLARLGRLVRSAPAAAALRRA